VPLTVDDEAQIVLRAQRGDAQAFAALVHRHERAVITLCSRYLRSTEAEDAAQDAFVRAYQALDRFDAGRPFAPWLYQIARRQCLDRLRKRKHEAPEAAEQAVALVRDPSVKIDAETALRVLKTLDEGPREALALFHLHELSYEEIAHTLEVPMGTVMTWIHRGRAALRAAMSKGVTS
jgi:RNA polymerase sigma-70 factor (ECF subfamily)